MNAFQILTYLCFGFIGILFIIALITISRYMFWFYLGECKKCGHHMYYRGVRHCDDENYYYFHCRHCGHWDKIPQSQYLKEIGLRDNDN